MKSASSGPKTHASRTASRRRYSPRRLRVRPLAAALKSGTLSAEGLLELRRNHYGEGLLRDHEFRRPAWEAVRKVWLQPAIQHEFAEMLREHVDELLDEVEAGSSSAPGRLGARPGKRLKPAFPAERRVDELARLLSAMEPTGAALPATERANLLVDWCQTSTGNGGSSRRVVLALARRKPGRVSESWWARRR